MVQVTGFRVQGLVRVQSQGSEVRFHDEGAGFMMGAQRSGFGVEGTGGLLGSPPLHCDPEHCS